jgi:integrase
VPVADVLTDALAEHLARFGPGPSIPDQITGELAQLIFASGRGRPVIGQLLDQAFLRAVRRAGLPEGSRFHDLRHFYAASLIDRGCSEREIGARLGHSSAQVTARYGHLLERADDRARAAGEATMQAIAEAALRAGRGGA